MIGTTKNSSSARSPPTILDAHQFYAPIQLCSAGKLYTCGSSLASLLEDPTGHKMVVLQIEKKYSISAHYQPASCSTLFAWYSLLSPGGLGTSSVKWSGPSVIRGISIKVVLHISNPFVMTLIIVLSPKSLHKYSRNECPPS